LPFYIATVRLNAEAGRGATASNPSNWASTLLQFIVLAVIFSMMILRGYQLEVLIWIRDIKGKGWKRICNALLLVLGDFLGIE
jgi:hypothetical protein